ncbi:MAG: PAS domain-containing protein, partial [Gemmatimonadota bacterium]
GLQEDEDRGFLRSEGERVLVDLSGLDGDGVDHALEALGNDFGLAAWIVLLAEVCAPRGPTAVEQGAHSYFVAESARAEDVATALESAEVWRARFVVERGKARALESLIAQVPGILWTTDRGNRFTSSRGPGLVGIGRGRAEGLDMGHDEFFGTPSSREEWAEANRRALEGEEIDFEQQAGDKVYSCWIRPLRDEDESVAGTVGLCVDVTLGRRLEDELRASRDRLERILENLLDPLAIYEAVRDETGDIQDFRIVYINKDGVQSLGLPRDHLVGEHLLELMPVHASNGLLDFYRDVVERGEAARLESFDFSDPEGLAPVEGLFDIGAFKVGDGFGVAWREVSQRVLQAEELRKSEQRLATVMQEAPLVLFTLDLDGTFTFAVGGA